MQRDTHTAYPSQTISFVHASLLSHLGVKIQAKFHRTNIILQFRFACLQSRERAVNTQSPTLPGENTLCLWEIHLSFAVSYTYKPMSNAHEFALQWLTQICPTCSAEAKISAWQEKGAPFWTTQQKQCRGNTCPGPDLHCTQKLG